MDGRHVDRPNSDGAWAVLNDHDVPRDLPPAGRAVLENLTWLRAAGRTPPAHWFTTLADPVTTGPVRDEIREIAAVAKANR